MMEVENDDEQAKQEMIDCCRKKFRKINEH